MRSFNHAIDKMISDSKKLVAIPVTVVGHVTPPLSRHAMHVFYKSTELKDAKYVGMWNAGKMHGK